MFGAFPSVSLPGQFCWHQGVSSSAQFIRKQLPSLKHSWRFLPKDTENPRYSMPSSSQSWLVRPTFSSLRSPRAVGVWSKADFGGRGTRIQIREHLNKAAIHRSMRGDHEMLRELANVVARPFLIVFVKSRWSGEVPEDQKKANGASVFKKDKEEDPGNYRVVGPT